MTCSYESLSPTRVRTVPRLDVMFDLRSRLRLSVIAVLFSPIVLDLIREGYALQLLGSAILGALIGTKLRPLARQPGGPVFITLASLLIWMGDVVLTSFTAERLVDLITLVASTVALWPNDPQDRVRKALKTLLRRIRIFSTGMPVHGT